MEVCKHCGTPTNSPDAVCDSCRSRNLTLNKMYEFYREFSNSINHSQRINDCINEYNYINSLGLDNSLWVTFWLIWVGLGGPTTLFILALVTSSVTADPGGATGGLIVFLLLTAIFMIFLITLILTIAKWKKYKEKQSASKSNKLANLDTRINAEKQQLTNLYNQTNQFIPEQYSNLTIVATLIQLVESRRADSLKEAINLYESIKHTDEMLRLQQEMSRNTEISAMANVVSAVANVGTAINTAQIARNTKN